MNSRCCHLLSCLVKGRKRFQEQGEIITQWPVFRCKNYRAEISAYSSHVHPRSGVESNAVLPVMGAKHESVPQMTDFTAYVIFFTKNQIPNNCHYCEESETLRGPEPHIGREQVRSTPNSSVAWSNVGLEISGQDACNNSGKSR